MGPPVGALAQVTDALRRALKPGDPVLISILRTDRAEDIAQALETWVASHTQGSVEGCLFVHVSVGATFGLQLSDGRRVVLKILRPTFDPRHMTSVRRVQRHLAENGFPCPAPMAGPALLGRGLAVLDEFLAAGRPPDPHDCVERRIMADGLFRLMDAAAGAPGATGLAHHHMNDRPGRVWPVPHSALFDFEATVLGAEWIDDFRRRAKAALVQGVGLRVVGHLDWSAANIRVDRTGLSAVYDWDSLTVEQETVVVARAAVHFTYTSCPDVPRMPSLEEARAFVDEYEASRGRAFSRRERRAIGAATVHSLAYTARCEHALDPQGASVPESARDFLYHYGEELLGTGVSAQVAIPRCRARVRETPPTTAPLVDARLGEGPGHETDDHRAGSTMTERP